VAGAHDHGTVATARVTKGLSTLKVITELLKRFRIELPNAKTSSLCPLREAVCATNEAQDTAGLIPALFEPKNKGIEMGTCEARPVSFLSKGPF
jgi:hypothetical protein